MDFLWKTFFGKILMTLLVSMVPIVELRGAIPIATAHGLEPYISIPIAILFMYTQKFYQEAMSGSVKG